MIKKLILIVAILSVELSYSQKKEVNAEIYYRATLGDNIKNIKQPIDKNVEAVMKSATDIDFVLKIKNQTALFDRVKLLKSDVNKGINLTDIISGKGIYYTDQVSSKIIHQHDVFGKQFLVNYPKLKWTITKEKKKIDNYLCYKATTIKQEEGRRGVINTPISAWFTTDIPLSFGPKEYSGLPGLILELQEGNKIIFVVKNLVLNKSDDIKINEPTKGKSITLENYNAEIKKYIQKARGN